MRIAIVTESFLPTLNGVTTSVCRVLDCLADSGHDVIVICPAPAPASYRGFAVHTVPSVPVRGFRAGIPVPRLEHLLATFAPDVVHAASPFGLGARALTVADALGIPAVAIYQTDMPSYLAQHSGAAGAAAHRAAWAWVRRLHSLADVTLAPSSAALDDLRRHGVPRVGLWARGVDTELFRPGHRTEPETAQLRRRIAPGGEVVIGYVGRLAPEKELERLAEVAELPGTRLAIVGDGPSRAHLTTTLPRATFLGRQEGAALARAYAAFDIFVHTGTKETFGQTLQEAMATGLPVVAPAAGGPLDIVTPGATGYLFDPDHPGALRTCVSSLVHEPETRERMGRAALTAVGDRSWAAMTSRLLDHYCAVVARAHQSAA